METLQVGIVEHLAVVVIDKSVEKRIEVRKRSAQNECCDQKGIAFPGFTSASGLTCFRGSFRVIRPAKRIHPTSGRKQSQYTASTTLFDFTIPFQRNCLRETSTQAGRPLESGGNHQVPPRSCLA